MGSPPLGRRWLDAVKRSSPEPAPAYRHPSAAAAAAEAIERNPREWCIFDATPFFAQMSLLPRLSSLLAIVPFVLAAWLGRRPSPDEPSGTEGDLQALVTRIQGGDREAEAELVARFSRGLRLMLGRLARNPALADDLHQETLALALEKIRRGEVREPDRLAGFLRGTARNLFIADRRRAVRYRALDEGEEGAAPSLAVADGAPAPFDRAAASEEARQVRRLLSELRHERDRQLLVRFYLSDDGKDEICADLGIEAERFNQVLFRARERLRELWERAEKRQRFFSGAARIAGRNAGDRAPER
jgi:RNA polymerase sigma-70 factor (ECF subfamily)